MGKYRRGKCEKSKGNCCCCCCWSSGFYKSPPYPLPLFSSFARRRVNLLLISSLALASASPPLTPHHSLETANVTHLLRLLVTRWPRSAARERKNFKPSFTAPYLSLLSFPPGFSIFKTVFSFFSFKLIFIL